MLDAVTEKMQAEDLSRIIKDVSSLEHQINPKVWKRVDANLNDRWFKTTPRSQQLISALDRNGDLSASTQFNVHNSALRALELVDGIVTTVGCLGNLREGKSALQNLILNKALGLPAGDTPTEYFATSSGVVSKTRGCSFFMFPHPLNQSCWVALFDFEGFGDPEKDQDHCSDYDQRLFAIGYAFLNTIIFNAKSGLDSFLVDRLRALKFVADIHLGKKKATAKPRQNPPQFLFTLRDFNLEHNNADLHYKDLLKAQKNFESLFREVKVHTLPLPVTDPRDLSRVSQFSRRHLNPRFCRAFDLFDKSLFEQTSPQLLPGESLANLIRVSVTIVNSGQSQPLYMSSQMEQHKVETFAHIAKQQFENALRKFESGAPLNEFQESKLLEEEKSKVLETFESATKPLQSLSLTAYIEGKRAEIIKSIEIHSSIFVNSNDTRAIKLAESLRNDLMQGAPTDEAIKYPKGNEKVYSSFMETTLATFQNLAIGPARILDSFKKQFENDLQKCYDMFSTWNSQRKAAVEAEMKLKNEVEKHENENKRLLGDIAEKVKNGEAATALLEQFKAQLADHTAKMSKLADDHKKALDDIVTEHQQELKTTTAEHEEKLKKALKEERERSEKEKKALNEKIEDQKRRADGLQGKVDSHQCKSGCFPGDASVQTKQGTKLMRNLQVGDTINTGEGQWELVLGWYDFEPFSEREFIILTITSGQQMCLTTNHLIFTSTSLEVSTMKLLQAGRVLSGMYVVDGSGKQSSKVVKIHYERRLGVFSPATFSGRLVVDGVLASAYAKPSEFADVNVSDTLVHQLSHSATFPLRLLWVGVGKLGLSRRVFASYVPMVVACLKLVGGNLAKLLYSS
jgi:hypothetical protein